MINAKQIAEYKKIIQMNLEWWKRRQSKRRTETLLTQEMEFDSNRLALKTRASRQDDR